MYLNGSDAIQIMRLVQKLKKKFIAKALTDIEAEFTHSDSMEKRVSNIRSEIDNRGAINTNDLRRLLDEFDNQMPEYFIIRKVVLDNFNEFSRNIFQALLGDVEGYGSPQDRRRY